MASKRALIEADLAVGVGIVGGVEVKVAVPVLIHREAGLIWQSQLSFPLFDDQIEAAGKVLKDLEAVAVVEWPEMAGATDWHAWRFPDR